MADDIGTTLVGFVSRWDSRRRIRSHNQAMGEERDGIKTAMGRDILGDGEPVEAGRMGGDDYGGMLPDRTRADCSIAREGHEYEVELNAFKFLMLDILCPGARLAG